MKVRQWMEMGLVGAALFSGAMVQDKKDGEGQKQPQEKQEAKAQWNALSKTAFDDLSEGEQRLLRETKARGFVAGNRRTESLSRAFQGRIKNDPTEEAKLPDKTDEANIWQFINEGLFKDAKVVVYKATSEDGEYTYWRIKSEKFLLRVSIPQDEGYPRFYILEPLDTSFEITEKSVAWDEEKHVIPCLSKVVQEDGWRDISLKEAESKKLREGKELKGAFFSFEWKQEEPFPSLRYVLIKEKFALFCLAYQ